MQPDVRHRRSRAIVRSSAVALVSLCMAAHAAPQADCAQRFQEALGAIAQHELLAIGDARAALTTADAALAGTWMFVKRSDRLRARLAQRLADGPLTQGDKVCAQATVDRGGRIRCLKWVDKANAPPRPSADLSRARDTHMSRSELALVSQLSRIVRSRGVLEEFDKNGRFSFLVSRTSDELGDYVRQQYRPGLCAGASEMMGFYDNALEPMRKRIEEFKRLVDSTRAWAGREAGRLDGGTSDTTSRSEKTPLVDLLVIVARRHLGEILAARMAAAEGLVARLALFEDALMTPEPPPGDGAPSPPAAPASPPVQSVTASSNAAGPAAATPEPDLVPFLRAVEAVAYAELTHGKTLRLDAAYKALMRSVVEAHARTCTCSD